MNINIVKINSLYIYNFCLAIICLLLIIYNYGISSRSSEFISGITLTLGLTSAIGILLRVFTILNGNIIYNI